MLIQKINPLKLTLKLIENSRKMGARHSLLDQAVLLVINENEGCSQLDIQEMIYGTRGIYNGAIYRPMRRLESSKLIEIIQVSGAATKFGDGRTSVKLTKAGRELLKSCEF